MENRRIHITYIFLFYSGEVLQRKHIDRANTKNQPNAFTIQCRTRLTTLFRRYTPSVSYYVWNRHKLLVNALFRLNINFFKQYSPSKIHRVLSNHCRDVNLCRYIWYETNSRIIVAWQQRPQTPCNFVNWRQIQTSIWDGYHLYICTQ